MKYTFFAIGTAVLNLSGCFDLHKEKLCAAPDTLRMVSEIGYGGPLPPELKSKLVFSEIVLDAVDRDTGKLTCSANYKLDLGATALGGEVKYDIQKSASNDDYVYSLYSGSPSSNGYSFAIALQLAASRQQQPVNPPPSVEPDVSPAPPPAAAEPEAAPAAAPPAASNTSTDADLKALLK
jgi:hypothetical protein